MFNCRRCNTVYLGIPLHAVVSPIARVVSPSKLIGVSSIVVAVLTPPRNVSPTTFHTPTRMNFAQILYQEKTHDELFTALKRWFGDEVNEVKVHQIVSDELIRLEWSTSRDPCELGTMLTEQFPDIVIETNSTNGIDLYSRFFNGTQLW